MMIPNRLAKLALVFALMLPGACLSVDIEGLVLCQGDTWSETTLYLGRGINGASIEDEAFTAFIEEEVASRFPDGFTLIHGQGAWKNTVLERTIFENSSMLVVLHPHSKPDRDALEEIAKSYIARFDQQAVIEARHDVCVTFITPEEEAT